MAEEGDAVAPAEGAADIELGPAGEVGVVEDEAVLAVMDIQYPPGGALVMVGVAASTCKKRPVLL